MARRLDFGASNNPLFIGEDLIFRFQAVKKNSSGVDVIEGDVSGNTYYLALKKHTEDAVILIDLDGGSITFDDGDTDEGELTGTNTVIVVAMPDAETELVTKEGLYAFDLWRTDAGAEAVVAFGTMYFSTSIRL